MFIEVNIQKIDLNALNMHEILSGDAANKNIFALVCLVKVMVQQ